MSHWRIMCRSVNWGWLLLLLYVTGCGSAGPAQTASTASTTDWLERVARKGPVKLVVRFSPPEPRLSDTARMEIEVTAEPGVEIKPPTFGQAVGDFVVRDYTERTEKKPAQKPTEPNVRRFDYRLEPMHAGRHLIRSLTIEFVDNRPNSEQKGATALVESDPFEVNVTSELGDQVPNLGNLEPMLPPRPLSRSSAWGWPIVVLIGVGVVGLIFWLRRRKRALAAEPRKLTPEEIAHAALAALLAENLPAQGLLKEFYLRLTDIVRHFIERKTGLRAPEQTTEEFLHAMRSRNVFSTERSERLKEFLEAADMVKYAGQQPGDDQIELSILRAREFVDLRSPVVVLSPVSTEGV